MHQVVGVFPPPGKRLCVTAQRRDAGFDPREVVVGAHAGRAERGGDRDAGQDGVA